MKKRPYQATRVNHVDVEKIGVSLSGARVIVALDIGKNQERAVIMTEQHEALVTVAWKHPEQSKEFFALLERLAKLSSMEVVMEPSGSYGHPFLYGCWSRGFPVFRVTGKQSHDAREIYDRVPSSHDGKSAHVVARLHLEGMSQRWVEPSSERRTLISATKTLKRKTDELHRKLNALEAELAGFWPELLDVTKLGRLFTLRLLSELPGPKQVADNPERARKILSKFGRFLTHTKIEKVISCASSTVAVPMVEAEQAALQALALEIIEARAQRKAAKKRVVDLKSLSQSAQNWSELVGDATAVVIAASVGEAANYSSAGAFVKVLGLNLKEQSSGKVRGVLRISKRGPRAARQVLFFAALRLTRSDPVIRAWYLRKVGRDGGKRMKAVIAVMRKLAKALWHVGRGAKFESSKLFDTSRLKLAAKEGRAA